MRNNFFREFFGVGFVSNRKMLMVIFFRRDYFYVWIVLTTDSWGGQLQLALSIANNGS